MASEVNVSKKLVDILRDNTLGNYIMDANGNFVSLGWSKTPDSYFLPIIVDIKQAFADAGYVTPENAKKVQDTINHMVTFANDTFQLPRIINVALNEEQQTMQKLMTGQEWYSRLEKELSKDFHLNDVGSTIWDSGDVMRAAKRASGLAEE